MGNKNNPYCACLGISSYTERNIHEINTDSSQPYPKESSSLIRRTKSRSMHHQSNKFLQIIEEGKNDDRSLRNNNENNTANTSKRQKLKKISTITTEVFVNKKGAQNFKTSKSNINLSSSLSPDSSHSPSCSCSSSENEFEESKEYSNERYFVTEKMQEYEKLFKNKLDLDGWKEFYNFTDKNVMPLIELGNDKIRIKSYCELITRLKNRYCYYKGEVDKDNNIFGYGELYFKNGEKYEGVFNDGKMNGWGRYINPNGVCFEGLFKNNCLTGKGIIIKEELINNKRTYYNYKGDIVNFLKEGKGIEKTDEYIYEGEFLNDLKEGKGKLTYFKGGEVYEGDFSRNEITGKGYYLFSNKNTYEGEFLNGKMHGKGLYTWWNGNQYEGEYSNNVKEGVGEYRWNYGKIYKGEFSKGVPHGKGILTIKGVSHEAIFEYGKFTGKISSDSISQSKLDYESEY